MKKIGKLKLNDASVMSDVEMKDVVGGSVPGMSCGHVCVGMCGGNNGGWGHCVPNYSGIGGGTWGSRPCACSVDEDYWW